MERWLGPHKYCPYPPVPRLEVFFLKKGIKRQRKEDGKKSIVNGIPLGFVGG